MDGARLGIGIIGAGAFGAAHAEALTALDGARLVAAARTNSVALQTFVERYGGKGYSDYRELLADEAVDAVVIATPHHLHTEIALHAAAAGKHILLEKPMAQTLEECDRIILAAQAAQVKLMVGHVNHFVPAYERAKQMLDSGEMGEIVMGISTMSKFWYEPNRRWWHLEQETGGGMWRTAGIHCLDRLTWLVGSPVYSVAAQIGTRFHQQKADDAGLVFLRYVNGAVGTIVSTAYASGAPKHLTELTCTKGMLNIDYTAGVSIGRDVVWQQIPDSAGENWMYEALVQEWRGFLQAIQTDGVPPVTGEYARHIMAVIFAAEEASRRQQEVMITEPSAKARWV